MENLKEITPFQNVNLEMINDDDVSSDCEILYEQIILNSPARRSLINAAEIEDTDIKIINTVENWEYPSYAKDEIELFKKLQSLQESSSLVETKNVVQVSKNENKTTASEDNDDSGVELEILFHCYPDSTNSELRRIEKEKTPPSIAAETKVIESEMKIRDSEVRRKRQRKEVNYKEDEEQSEMEMEEYSSKWEVFQRPNLPLSKNDSKNDNHPSVVSVIRDCKTRSSKRKKAKSNCGKKKIINMTKSRLYCKSCKKLFPSRVKISEHSMRVHSDERPWQCKYCPNNYQRSNNLQRHIRSKH